MSKFAVIIVTYNPNPVILRSCIYSLYGQIDLIILVKNSCEVINLDNMDRKKTEIIQLDKNYGIAYAQNRGIEYALRHEADFILFSDQDTIYPNDFIKKISNCFECHKKEKLAAVVPLFYNENKKQYAQISIGKTHVITADLGKEYYVSHAISSGTVVTAEVIQKIGGMNERLFIDWVDYEWCWRAFKQHYKIICDTNIVIRHKMGDSFKKVLGRKIVVYSDSRNYFFLRNGIWLLFHSHLFSIREWFCFANFMILKSILFFITCGISLKHLKLFFKAVGKGIGNGFSLEDSIR